MYKMPYICATFLAVICSASSFADEFDLMREEQIGAFRIGLSEDKVNKSIDCSIKRGPEQLWGADGAYHQEWEYVGCGITLGMVSEEKGKSKSIESITVTAPSIVGTKQGIHIGSTEQEVISAYEPYWNREESVSGNIVAGSIYGGLIFSFEDGLVSRIFLGAAAE